MSTGASLSLKGVIAWLLGALVALVASPAAVGLPDGRAYELVSPPDKNGGAVLPAVGTVAPGGQSVFYTSPAGFADPEGAGRLNGYVGTRGVSAWATQPVSPPLGSGFGFNDISLRGIAPDLSRTVVLSNEPLTPDSPVGSPPQGVYNLYLRDNRSGEYELMTPDGPSDIFGALFYQPTFVTGNPDYSHVMFGTDFPIIDDSPDDGSYNFYEYSDGDVRLVNVLDDGTVADDMDPASFFQSINSTNAISADGSRIFFPSSGHVWVREDGATTRVTPPSGGTLVQASRDGSSILLRTAEGLVRHDLDSGTDTPVAAGASWLMAQSHDGSHVYFASDAPPSPGEGVAGEQNLYLWTEAGDVTFIATLDEEDENVDFSVSTPWEPLTPTTRSATPDGRHLLFASSTPLTGYDNAHHQMYFHYDAATGELSCVSCRPDGGPVTGPARLRAFNDSAVNINSIPTDGRPLTDDGRHVFFSTPDTLVPGDTNGRDDAYQWRDGELSLLSTGRSDGGSYFLGASASGDDAYFVTDESLVPIDDDGAPDVYNARVGGGLAGQRPVPPPAACRDDECQGARGAGRAAGVPGSAELKGPGNAATPVRATLALRAPSQRLRVLGSRTGTVRLTVRANRPGLVRVTVRAKLGHGSRVVAKGGRRLAKAGSAQVRLRLSRPARQRLSTGKPLLLRVIATSAGAPSRTLAFRLPGRSK